MTALLFIAAVVVLGLLGGATTGRDGQRKPRRLVAAADIAQLRRAAGVPSRRVEIVRRIDRIHVTGTFWVPEDVGGALIAAAEDPLLDVRVCALETLGRLYVRFDSPGGPMNMELMEAVAGLVGRRRVDGCGSLNEARLLGELHGKFGAPSDADLDEPASGIRRAYIEGIVEGLLHHEDVPHAWLDLLTKVMPPAAWTELRDAWNSSCG